ncbi:glycosyl hydrolase family 28 protein [Bacteroides sp. 51]|uniref:glycosyl hydrolase family 28 protein n=1 Tax=Bacteroides sp. 51 TaxID=2302938 RepID=UPI0013D6E5D6|nr:glycosyl hydrolase family 28 protein [Bacteroides sp. 51]NDV81757.1 hypothetical protein [Bacteroides sp. 51]
MRNMILKIKFVLLLVCFFQVEANGSFITKSTSFEVRMDGQEQFVHMFGQFDIPVHAVHYTLSDSKSINIKVKAKEEIQTYSISPLSRGIVGCVDGKELSFTLDKPEYLIIKINELEYLFLMIDTPIEEPLESAYVKITNILDYDVDNTGHTLSTSLLQRAIDETARERSILYIPDGTYKTGQLNLPDHARIFLAPNACIKASTDTIDFPDKALLYMNSARHIQIFGHGTIDGSGYTGLRENGGQGYYLIYISTCIDINMNGPLLLDPCFWNARVYRSKNVNLRNIKVLNNRPAENWNNTDGIDFDSSVHCSLVNGILHCGDDNLVVKGLDAEHQFNTENIRFERIVTLSNSAATKIGTETCVEHFKNITFKDIDIVKCKRAMVINAYDSALVHHIVFENINIESFEYNGVEAPRMIDFEITDTSWRPCAGDCMIENVVIKNINIHCDIEQVHSQIIGKSDMYAVRNTAIENVKVKGKPVEYKKDINLLTNDYVFDLAIKP